MKFLQALPDFKDKWILYLLLAVIPFILYFSLSIRRRGSIKFSTVNKFKVLKPGWKFKFRHLPAILRSLAVVFLITGLARPRKGNEIKKQITQGIAIQMVIDKSGSMSKNMSYNNTNRTRLEVVKEVFKQFVNGKLQGDKKGRDNDLIGITSYSGLVEFNCPLTLEHGNFDSFLENIQVFNLEKFCEKNGFLEHLQFASQFGLNHYAAQYGNTEKGKEFLSIIPAINQSSSTAIGDALYYSVLKLIEADKYFTKKDEKDYTIKNKIIILLTDGQHNSGKFQPSDGAELAAANNIKVYTIGIGSKRGGQYQDGILGTFFSGASPEDEVDEETLKMIAQTTGGKFYFADDGEKLKDIYEKIDKLEKTKIEDFSYLEYNELYRKYVIIGFIFLVLEIILANTLFRRIP